MDHDDERRVGRNQALFRQTNEAIEQGLWPGEPRKTVRFRCECARLECHDVVEVSVAEYESVRAFSRRFLVRAGHEIAEVERVIEQHDGWVVVEKNGIAGLTASQTDPRGEQQADQQSTEADQQSTADPQGQA